MKNGLIIADSGPIFSLATIDKLHLLNDLFSDVFIPYAVWDEITRNSNVVYYNAIVNFFRYRIHKSNSVNDEFLSLDLGETESIFLYEHLKADYLLLDDRKARKVAEARKINCIGTLGILTKSKEIGLISELRPLFEIFLNRKRYYSIDLMNQILTKFSEKPIDIILK